MKWFRRVWARRRKKIEEVDDTQSFLLSLNATFINVNWAQDILHQFISLMDRHCENEHEYIEECDLLCGPDFISRYVTEQITAEDARYLAVVAIKYWYQCYVALRQQHGESHNI